MLTEEEHEIYQMMSPEQRGILECAAMAITEWDVNLLIHIFNIQDDMIPFLVSSVGHSEDKNRIKFNDATHRLWKHHQSIQEILGC